MYFELKSSIFPCGHFLFIHRKMIETFRYEQKSRLNIFVYKNRVFFYFVLILYPSSLNCCVSTETDCFVAKKHPHKTVWNLLNLKRPCRCLTAVHSSTFFARVQRWGRKRKVGKQLVFITIRYDDGACVVHGNKSSCGYNYTENCHRNNVMYTWRVRHAPVK